MKVQLIAVGKMNDAPLVAAVEKYVKRIVRYVPFQVITIPDVKTSRATTPQRQKEAEGAALLAAIDQRDFVVLLDERGHEFTSREFAAYFDRRTLSLPGNIVFVIGGPYGFSQQVYDRANDKLSLSRMTLTHEMVRLFFVEQLYRAMTILRGEPYHHD